MLERFTSQAVKGVETLLNGQYLFIALKLELLFFIFLILLDVLYILVR